MAGEFEAAEAAMTDYFDRMVFVSRRVFPSNGFLLYGMHPYVGQLWVPDPWRPIVSPDLHTSRLSRSFDYNLRRALFTLWIRTGDRRFYDYARAHARFSHDVQFSNAGEGIKPKGWLVIGDEDPPMLWGSYSANANLDQPLTARFGNSSALALGGGDDLAQLVQAYFLTADFHARDMVQSWKAAVARELVTPPPPRQPLTVDELKAREHPEALLRMLAAAYDLDSSEASASP